MKKLLKDKDLTEADLRPGDVILTGGGNFGEGRGDAGNLCDRYFTAADFGRIIFYVGNGQVIKEGWKRKSSLQSVLQEVGYALVFRPEYLQKQKATSIVQHVSQLSQHDYADLNAFNSWRHHPKSLRYYPKHGVNQAVSSQFGQIDNTLSPRSAFQRGNLKCIGQLKGNKGTSDEKKKETFSKPRKSQIFAYSKIEEIPPKKKTVASLPPRKKDPIEEVAPAQAATLKEAAKNGTPFCEQ